MNQSHGSTVFVESNLSTPQNKENLNVPQRRKYATFGPYIIGSTLGEGEFGKVKLGWTRSKDKNEIPNQVAIKLIRRDNIKDNPDKEMKIYREINALKHLNHPNIIKLEEILQNSKYIGIVLEYASGGEFYRYIQRKRRLKEVDACRLFAQLISGVNYMHYKGLVHRDLKLENLLLDKNENLVITDFGFVNEFSPQNQLMKTSCGSPCYAAPELVVSTHPYEGTKADTWSCGIILFAMLAGYLPWDDDPTNPNGDDISRLYQYITHTPLKFPDYVNPLVRDLLRRILVSDPRRRFNIQGIRNHEWLSPYHNFLNISPYDWDVAGKLGPTALNNLQISSNNNNNNNKGRIRPRSMINTGNSSLNRNQFDHSRVSELSASMNKLNILKEDVSEDTIKSAYSENYKTSKSTNIVHKLSSDDIRKASVNSDVYSKPIHDNRSRTRPRPTTLHITVNPSLKPITVDSTSNDLSTDNSHSARYNRTYSKKSLNQHEPRKSVIINTINEVDKELELQENKIQDKCKDPPRIIINKNEATNDYDHNGKEATIKQVEPHSQIQDKRKSMNTNFNMHENRTVSGRPSPPVIFESNSNKDSKINKFDHQSSQKRHRNRKDSLYKGNDSSSSIKMSKDIESNERKRFSFLSLYSSYTSTKSSLLKEESMKTNSRSKDMTPSELIDNSYDHERNSSTLSHGFNESRQIRSDSRNSTLYTTAPSSVRTLHNLSNSSHQKNQSINSMNYENNNLKHNKPIQHSIRNNNRSSIMVSSLKEKKNKTKHSTKREVSTARKVIDFFKRKSTLL